jgi:hypothetical protein
MAPTTYRHKKRKNSTTKQQRHLQTWQWRQLTTRTYYLHCQTRTPHSQTSLQQRKKSLQHCRRNYGVAEPQIRHQHTDNRQHQTRLNATAGHTESAYPVTTTAPTAPTQERGTEATPLEKTKWGKNA